MIAKITTFRKTSLKAVYSWLTSGQINFKVFGPLQPAFHSIISAVPVIGKNKDEDEVFEWVFYFYFIEGNNVENSVCDIESVESVSNV